MSNGEDHRQLVRSAVLDESSFVRLTLAKKLRDDGKAWVKIVVRPVTVKGRRAMQFSYFEAKRDFTKNYRGDEVGNRLDEILDMPFGHVIVHSTAGDITVRITRKGNVLVSRGKPSRAPAELTHDRAKGRALPLGEPDEFLRAIGVTDERGQVRPGMRAKYRQINEFLRAIEETVVKGVPRSRRVSMVDCGCGSAHLSFAAYHHLSRTREVSLVGIDLNEELVERNRKLAVSLGWTGIEFLSRRILDYTPDGPPDAVVSLHACDTATDEAIVQGIRWGSRVILAAPCCQHELHDQLKSPLFRPVLRHGVLKERLADILTDTFRALVLRIMGYRTKVVEFVSPEATSKNLMIRAELGAERANPAAIRQYLDLKCYWSVTPAIETLLGDPFKRLLA